MSTDTEVTPLQVPDKGSRWEDLVDVIFAPRDLFVRRADDSWGMPFLMLCIISMVLYYVFLPFNAMIWQAAMIENAPPNADPDQIRQSAAIMKYFGGVFVPVGYVLVIAVTALALKLASSVIEPPAKWSQSFTIATYSMFVVIPQEILAALMVFMKSRSGTVEMSDASFGVLRFMDKPDPVVRAVLGRFDIFPIWSAVLCAIGLIVLVRMPRGKAILTAAIAWLVIALPGLASAALVGRK